MGYIQCYCREKEENEVKFQNGNPENKTQENAKIFINLKNNYDKLEKENNTNIQKIKELENKITILEKNNNNNNAKKTILFEFENGKKYEAITFDRSLLRDEVFPLILEQMENDDKLDIEKLTFNHNGLDITQHFLNNDPVRSLNLTAKIIIEVNKANNFLLDKTAILNKNKINKFNYFS